MQLIKKDVEAKNREAAFLNDEERQRCEIWTRVMGYHRPVASFNIGKKGEFHEREFFREPVGSHLSSWTCD